ncbi:transmembrane amino acid transporter protein-domain-containing protein [Terfezia claveryi]|nr:transmembrane amino acid transporter protein-domain-containing protein [Terfezia claveryi]
MPDFNYEAITQDVPTENIDGASMPVSFTSIGGTRRQRRASKRYKGEASWISCVVNLLNTIVGAGVLAMPGAMSKFGITLGVFIIFFCGFTSAFGLYLQSRCARYIERGNASFFSLSQLTYPNAAVLFDGAIAIKCFGVGISYLIIIGNLMPLVVGGLVEDAGGVWVDRQFWVTVFMLIVIPLSFLRRLDSLKYTSFIALVSIGYLVIIVVGHFLKGDTIPDRGEVHWVQWAGPVQALSSFPVIVFAYTCHQNMFSIVNEINDNSHRSTTSVITGSIGSAAGIYLLVAITGYLSYGDNVNGNIISMYPPNVISTIGRLAIVILVLFSFPLQCHPARASIGNVLKWRPLKPTSPATLLTPLPPTAFSHTPMSDTRFAIITSTILISSYMVAMSVSSLERVLAWVGSTGSTSISFILPGVFYWRISDPGLGVLVQKGDEDEDVWEEWHERVFREPEGWEARYLRWGAAVLVGWGLVVMCVCVGLNFFLAGAGGGH